MTPPTKVNRALHAMLRKHERMESMHRIKVPPQPPSYNMQPWFPLTVRLLNPGVSITKAQLNAAVASQLQQPATFFCEVRLQSASFWGALAGPGEMVPLTVRFVDPLSIDSIASAASLDSAMVIQDYPDAVNRARVGFKYSKAQQNHTIGSTLGSSEIVWTTVGMGNNSVAYVHLLWRPQALTAPTVESTLTDSESDIEILGKSSVSARSSRRR